jgi:hypothetical protein
MTETRTAKESLLAAIKEQSKKDPLIGSKLGAKEVLQRLIGGLKNERGVHVESLLCALGSLAGYSCQVAVVARAKTRGAPSPLKVISTNSGQRFFMGDALNNPLAESKYSVWGIAASAAIQPGLAALPNLEEMFAYVNETIGGESFGKIRVPEGRGTGDLPINYVKKLWPVFRPLIAEFCPNPDHWPILFALAAQEAIVMGKEAIDPGLALRITMESAIAMSKVELSFEEASATATKTYLSQPRSPNVSTISAARGSVKATSTTIDSTSANTATAEEPITFQYAASKGSIIRAAVALVVLPLLVAATGNVFLIAIGVMIGIVGFFLLRRLSSKPTPLTLGPARVTLPSTAGRGEMISHKYEYIHRMDMQTFSRQRVLIVASPSGESWLLPSNFENEQELNRFMNALAKRVAASKSK